VNDEETTHQVLTAVRSAVPDARMRTPVEQIMGTARSRRRRRGFAGLTVAGLAGAAGLAIALPAGGTGTAGNGGARPGNAQLAAWTVQNGPDGTVNVTLHQARDAQRLQRVLAEHGVPAIVRFGEVCQPEGKALPASELNQVLGLSGAGLAVVGGPDPVVFRIKPAKMPSGSKLSLDVLPNRVNTAALVPAGEGVTCHAPGTGS
jgi:hypothetical protein